MKVLAQTLSVLLYPMFIPAYAMGLLCFAINRQAAILPSAYIWLVIIGTLVFTCIIPLTTTLLLVRKDRLTDLYITNREERSIPYLYSICSMIIWWFFLYHIVKMPTIVLVLAGGGIATLAAVTLINLRWKISVHLSSFGSLIGAVSGYCLHVGLMPIALLSSLLLVALVLIYARLYLDAHTPLQTVVGLLLGLLFTFTPALFI